MIRLTVMGQIPLKGWKPYGEWVEDQVDRYVMGGSELDRLAAFLRRSGQDLGPWYGVKKSRKRSIVKSST